MSTPPRRRRPDARRPKPEGGGWLPTIALGLGVVVAGLGIGALVAVLMQRNAGKLAAVAVLTSAPPPSRTPGRTPIVLATIKPPRTSGPSPGPSPTPEQSLEPTDAPSSRLTVSPTAAPAAKPTRAMEAGTIALATVSPMRVTAVTPAPIANPSLPAQAPQPAAATSEAPAAPVPAPPGASPDVTPATQSAYDEHASAVVRRYVGALIRGDEKTAYTALGGSGGTLSERSFLDPSARIVSVKVIHIDASNASVGCEIAAAKGHYYATYHVTAASSGPYISQHEFIKV